LSKFRRRSARGTKWTLAYSLQSPPNWEYCHPRTDSSKARNPRPELPTASSFDAPKQHPLNAQDEPSSVGSCSKLTEVIQTDASFGISFEMEVASSAAGLFQSQLASVNTTSAANGNLPSCTGDALISRFMGQVHADCSRKPPFLERPSGLWFVS
jgi:hypothetical protein